MASTEYKPALQPLYQLKADEARKKAEAEFLNKRVAALAEQQQRLTKDIADIEAQQKSATDSMTDYAKKEVGLAVLRKELGAFATAQIEELKKELKQIATKADDDRRELKTHLEELSKEMAAAKTASDEAQEKADATLKPLNEAQAEFDETKNKIKLLSDGFEQLKAYRDKASASGDTRTTYVLASEIKERLESKGLAVASKGEMDKDLRKALDKLILAKAQTHDAAGKAADTKLALDEAKGKYAKAQAGRLDLLLGSTKESTKESDKAPATSPPQPA